ncbi:peptide/nickel transport system ATP-binding protein [Actinocorallia herbida]|uniref:Peptide/nickel transport system ATP-binding protein n=1 Tax=Actinocorallia herbida TaxID=58109 RepID=A0A3N1D1T0_9ACTN|nr:ABC transporter ATP-binding protein [Actinocorallia herbida]ROO87472.1 peptide/nickel transport system ATP-binding protein [Actinocorallia herbida]
MPIAESGPSAKAPPVLEVSGLNVEFATPDGPIRVVEDVDLTIPRGTTVGLVGESGSGKTVTSLAVMGLLPKETARVTGSIRLSGRELVGMGARELSDIRGARMAMVFQEPRRSLDPAFTVGDQIAEVLRRHERPGRRAAGEKAVALLDRVGIADAGRRARAYPHEFSGGMCQRVMLAIALACKPELLIADEPTTALDVTVQKDMLDLMNELQAELDVSILFITHDLGVVAQMCDWVNVMYAGQVVESTPMERLFRRPGHPYTEGLLAAVPETTPKNGRLRAIPGIVPAPADWPVGCRFAPRCGHVHAEPCESGPVTLTPDERGRSVRCVRGDEITLKGIEE